MSAISDIVNVTIDITTPTATEAAYNGLLLVVDAPTSVGTATLGDVTEIKALSELAQYGFATNSGAYKACEVAFAQNPRPVSVYLADVRSVDGTTEAIGTTLNRALGASLDWYGFCIVTTSQTSLSDAATWAETNKRLLGICWTTGTTPAYLVTKEMTFGIYAGNHETVAAGAVDYNPYANVALMAKCFGYEQGSETWAEKTLAKILPSKLSSAETATIVAAGGNTYEKLGNYSATVNGKVGSGEWIDVIRFRDWLLSKIQNDVFAFFIENPKVAYTDNGITGIYNVVNAVLKLGQDHNGISPTYMENGVTVPGYTISVPRAKDVSAATKATRKLTNVKFTAKLAGAIHETTIQGTLAN